MIFRKLLIPVASTFCLLLCCNEGSSTLDDLWLDCQPSEYANDVSGTIYEGQSKIFEINFRRKKTEYKYLWMGFKENNNYRTAAYDISGYAVSSSTMHSINVFFNIVATDNVPSGAYTMYVAVGEQPYVQIISDKTPEPCINFESGDGPSPISVNLEFDPTFPINYEIKDHYLYSIPLQTRVRGMDPGGVWARVYLEVTMPPANQIFESNYYTYFIDNDFHWENMMLEFGGGSYIWDGDMPITARVKLYDTWPGGNEITHRSFTFPHPSKVLKPATTPTLEQIDIEYDQQIGQNLFDDILYLDGAIGKSDIIDAAFAPALLKMAFYKDVNHQTLPIQDIDMQQSVNVANYIFDHHSNTSHKYFCAVERVLDDEGNEAYGVRANIPTNQGVARGVFVAYSKHATVNEPYTGANLEGFREQILTNTVVHELGHYLGISGHEGHTLGNIYCVMYQDFYPEISYQKRRSFYVNPHFCENHVNILKNNN